MSNRHETLKKTGTFQIQTGEKEQKHAQPQQDVLIPQNELDDIKRSSTLKELRTTVANAMPAELQLGDLPIHAGREEEDAGGIVQTEFERRLSSEEYDGFVVYEDDYKVTGNPYASGEAYKDVLTSKERQKLSGTVGTELFEKQANAKRIIRMQDALEEDKRKKKEAVAKDLNLDETDPRYAALEKLVPCLGDDVETNKWLLKLWTAGIEPKDNMPEEEAQRRGKRAVMKTFMTVYIRYFENAVKKIPPLTADENIAESAHIMERNCDMLDAIEEIGSSLGEDYQEIDEELRKKFQPAFEEGFELATRYRLCRQVITNPYYISHQKDEIGKSCSQWDSEEKKDLARLIWQANGGLKKWKAKATGFLDGQKDPIRLYTKIPQNAGGGVREQQLKLQKELAARRERISKMGFAAYYGHLLDPEAQADSATDWTTIRQMKNLELPADDPMKALEQLSGVLDQLDIAQMANRLKQNNANSYNLDQSYRQIAKADKACELVLPLERMRNALLVLGRLSSEGGLKTDRLSAEEIEAATQEYKEAVKDYQKKMKAYQDVDEKIFPAPDVEMLKTRAKNNDWMVELKSRRKKLEERAKKDGQAKEGEQAEQDEQEKKEWEAKWTKRRKDLMDELAKADFSELALYEHAEEIYILQEELMPSEKGVKASEEAIAWWKLSLAATQILDRKRLLDLEEVLRTGDPSAKKRKEYEDRRQKLSKIIEGRQNTEKVKKASAKRNEQEAGQDEQQRITPEDYQAAEEYVLLCRAKAQKAKFDKADLAAEKSHYMFQEEWALNTKHTKKSILNRFYTSIVELLSNSFSAPRHANHGAVRYTEAKESLNRVHADLKGLGEREVIIKHGDAAPEIDLGRYFPDKMKMNLVWLYRNFKEKFETCRGEKVWKDHEARLNVMLEALESYSQVRGAVTSDTVEMEWAFLDKFKKEWVEFEAKFEGSKEAPAYKVLVNIQDALSGDANGSLMTADKLSEEDIELIKQQKPIYVASSKEKSGSSIYSGPESNVKNLPLFSHEPNLNDIKQGTIGNCFMLGAIQSVTAQNPQAIRDMFHDLGDGTVVVRLYAGFGVDTFKNGKSFNAYSRIDEKSDLLDNESVQMRPVYIRVAKQYETGEGFSCDSLWVQLLEKAYAAAGFNHGASRVEKDGRLRNRLDELTDGDAAEVMTHLTGKLYRGKTDDIEITISGFKNLQKEYSDKEKRLLRLIKLQTDAGRRPAVDFPGHVQTALATKVHNGKWYVLIKDPFNVEQISYEEKQDGSVKTKRLGTMDAITNHSKARLLDGTLGTAFKGTSWYELSDLGKLVSGVTYQDGFYEEAMEKEKEKLKKEIARKNQAMKEQREKKKQQAQKKEQAPENQVEGENQEQIPKNQGEGEKQDQKQQAEEKGKKEVNAQEDQDEVMDLWAM